MKLSTRILLLILGCLVPILVAQLFTLNRQYAEKQARLRDTIQWQAEWTIRDLAAVIEDVRAAATVVTKMPEVVAGPGCEERLTPLSTSVPSIAFVALTDATGRLQCTTEPLVAAAWGGRPAWLPDLSGGERLGPATTLPGLTRSFLPIGVVFPTAEDNRRLVVGLDLAWFADHLRTTQPWSPSLPSRPFLFVTDRDGNIVARDNRTDDRSKALSLGTLPPTLKPLAGMTGSGQLALIDDDGLRWMTAYVPRPIGATQGLMSIAAIPVPPAAIAFAMSIVWDLLVTVGFALLALMIVAQAGHQHIYKPTEALIHAVERWRDGDMTARADPGEKGTEFASLAQAFNALVARLQARDLERRLQSELLESQVAERTRALSEMNNRLQVEVAEREKTEAALLQAQKLQAVGQLAGGVAHDFNNMLATVLGNLELMQLRVGQAAKLLPQADAERLSALIERATGAVQRGAQLTSRLLAFSRRQRLTTRTTDLNKLASELVSLATSTLGQKVRVTNELANDLWAVSVDPAQIESALLNLCLNARDAMPEGGRITIVTRNEPFERAQPDDPPTGDYVRIAVRDTGHGMSAEVLRRAFEPFFTTKGVGGSGLGLSQVYGIARQSGGTVKIESTEGVGTEVALLLPRTAAATEAETAAKPAALSPADMSKLLVMVVDDDDAVRLVAVEMLRDLGCRVIQAVDGEDALKVVEAQPAHPDLILMDYAMPNMNGLRCAAALRERGVMAPIGLVTGYAEAAESDTELDPLDGLLRKPFSIQDMRGLLETLRSRIGMHRPVA